MKAPELFPIEYLSPEQLVAHPKNWALHGAKQTGAVAASIAEFGWIEAVVVNKRTGRIVNGHARVAVALTSGVTRIPCRMVDVDEATELRMLATINRTGDLRDTDEAALKQLLSDCTWADDAAPLPGWDEGDLTALFDPGEEEPAPQKGAAPPFDPGAGTDDDLGPGSGTAPPALAHVRMVQLFLDGTTHPEFMGLVEELKGDQAFGVETVTDAVLEAVRYAHHQVVTCKK